MKTNLLQSGQVRRTPQDCINVFFIRRLNTLVILHFSPAYIMSSEFTREVNNALYLSVNVFSTKVLTGDTIFYVSLWRRDCHFTWSAWSPKPSEGLTVCNAKAVPSFLRYIKTLMISSGHGNRTHDLPQSSALSTELVLPR